MVKGCDAFDGGNYAAVGHSVAAIGIRQARVGRRCQLFVGNDGAVRPDEVGAEAYGLAPVGRYAEEVGHVAAQMARFGLLGEAEPYAGNAVTS